MKKQAATIFFLFCFCILSHAQKRVFLRLYSPAGNKFQKGYFAGTTDSSLFLYRDSSKTEIPVSDIGFIKTRRSLGHHLLVGALVVAVPSGIIGLASGEPRQTTSGNISLGSILHDAFTLTPGEGLEVSLVVGGTAGAAGGAIVTASNKKYTYRVYGDRSNWKQQRIAIDQLPVYSGRK